MDTELNLFKKKNKLPLIKQVQFSECGHACIAMISNFHGHHIDLHHLRTIEEPAINGTNMSDLVRLLTHLKFHTRVIRADINELKTIQSPVILHWNMNHFVVLDTVNSRYAIIHDPAVGRRKISLTELSDSFTGVILEVEKNEDFSAIIASNRLGILDLFRCFQGLKNSLFILLILSLVIELFILINPIFLQFITDNVSSVNNLHNLFVIALGFIILIICHTFTEYIRSNFVVYLTNRMSEYFSSGVMNHLLKLPFDYFERRHKGDILSRFHSMKEIQNKMTTDSINTLLDGVVIILTMIIMLIYSVPLACMAVVSLAIYLTLRILSYNHLKSQTEISIGEHANVNSRFLEILQSIMPIKLYAKEATLFRDWKNYLIKAMNADIKIARANILYSTTNIFLFNIEYVMVITIGAILITKNHFSVGMLIAFLAYRQILINKATSFMHKIIDFKLVSVQIERVADILTHKPEAESHVIIDADVHGKVSIQQLHYKYPGSQQFVLNDINFQVSPAEKVVITGPSGIGKTTLLKIMLGLIQPTSGKILIDDIELNLLGAKKYRAACASVMQDDTLISGSILDNITFMDNKIDIERVHAVAKSAQIHDDILKMPMSYETLIGDMGSALSGGQKQRVLLARALYKRPKILFLDEATSHLDVETEIKINQSLKQLQITQIMIAHREESIKMADRVIHLS